MIRIAVLLSILVAPAVAGQNASEIAVIACKNALVQKVRTERPDAADVRMSPGPRVTQTPGRNPTVEGAGQYFDRTSREWRDFTYSCTYNTSSGGAKVTVRYGGAGGMGP